MMNDNRWWKSMQECEGIFFFFVKCGSLNEKYGSHKEIFFSF
jgi:hypothetical protein